MKLQNIYRRTLDSEKTWYLQTIQVPAEWKLSSQLKPCSSANCASCGACFFDNRDKFLYPNYLLDASNASHLGICRHCFNALNQLRKANGLRPEINTLNPARFQLRSYDLEHDRWDAFQPPQNYQLVFENEKDSLDFMKYATCPLCGLICCATELVFSNGNCVRHWDGEVCGTCEKCAAAFRRRAKELGCPTFAPKYPTG